MKAWHICLIFIGGSIILGYLFAGFSGSGSFGVYGSVLGITGYLIYRATKRNKTKSEYV